MLYIHEEINGKHNKYPEKILQFGEGNFLRAFSCWMIDLLNEKEGYNGSVAICQPIEVGMTDLLNQQNCMYTVAMRGLENKKEIEQFHKVTSISRCINPYKDFDELLQLACLPSLRVIISNTTEAGITYNAGDKYTDAPPTSFPAKLCIVLHKRFKVLGANAESGCLILPTELIDDNGKQLKRIVLQYAKEWALEAEFCEWINTSCEFANTMVDRIVTGYPRDNILDFENKLGYKDEALVTCELYNSWVIEADKKWSQVFPAHKVANVIWVDDATPYKKRKVRILNGSHTSVIPLAYVAGYETVLDFFVDSEFGKFERKLIYDEIIPTLDMDGVSEFAASVIERFMNPFIVHRLADITLNNSSKFVARCVPTILDYAEKYNSPPPLFAFAIAGYIRYYKSREFDGAYIGTRDTGEEYTLRDDRKALDFYNKLWQTDDITSIVSGALEREGLANINGLANEVCMHLSNMVTKGMKKSLEEAQYV